MKKAIDLSPYPQIQDKVKIAGIEDRQEYIIWNKLSKEETATAIAELSLLCRASISMSMPARKKAKQALNFYKTTVGSKIHPFAAAQAREELGLSSSRMQELLQQQFVQLCIESE
ncbi:hypothetical protein ABER99_21680 [Paenibacillus glucanolyticus]|uniref:Uncharacterized protein n=2 Tax=Paenibacillus glucanolyticus TaxID=59843 RepID=A0A163GRX2_9BACL|nr:hypothetical protein [Paenibacillus glucanolyticus]KZS45118.1 hypothetical protein AWU65_03815 [Paenibacillus glucanolyticus]OMF64120.1 hypothetical protein BK142_32245 [Paenibacillus glucanolyticus]